MPTTKPKPRTRLLAAAVLKRLGACDEARRWTGGKRTIQQAWEECERGDWMLWAAGNLGIDRKLLVTAACKCARLALRYVPAGETRPLKAIETAEAWARGEATIEQVRVARDAAWDARRAMWRTAADAAADAAAAAADAAADAADAADAARSGVRKECADLVRQTIPFAEISRLAWRFK